VVSATFINNLPFCQYNKLYNKHFIGYWTFVKYLSLLPLDLPKFSYYYSPFVLPYNDPYALHSQLQPTTHLRPEPI